MNITVNGKVTNSYSYSMDGQIASSINYGSSSASSSAEATGGQAESFLWDGLALLKRGTTEYVNEPAPSGSTERSAPSGATERSHTLTKVYTERSQEHRAERHRAERHRAEPYTERSHTLTKVDFEHK